MKHLCFLAVSILCLSFFLGCSQIGSNSSIPNSDASSNPVSPPNNTSVATPTMKDQTDPIGNDKDKALMESACHNEEVGVDDALRAGANPNIHDGTGKTPLMCAISYPSIVRKLLDAGAKVEPVDQNGDSALSYACGWHYETARLLIENGADVNVKDKDGDTPLLAVSSARSEEGMDMMRLLIEKGANVNVKNSKGTTPLLASLSGVTQSDEMARLLVERGADVNAKDNEGMTPLILVIDNHKVHVGVRNSLDGNGVSMVRLLLEQGADANAAHPHLLSGSMPALCLAVQGRDEDLVQLLLAHKANVDVRCGSSSDSLIEQLNKEIDFYRKHSSADPDYLYYDERIRELLLGAGKR